MMFSLHSGVADLNPLSEKYKDHIRSFLPKLRSFNMIRGAKYLEDWIEGALVPLPPLDISKFLGLRSHDIHKVGSAALDESTDPKSCLLLQGAWWTLSQVPEVQLFHSAKGLLRSPMP